MAQIMMTRILRKVGVQELTKPEFNAPTHDPTSNVQTTTAEISPSSTRSSSNPAATKLFNLRLTHRASNKKATSLRGRPSDLASQRAIGVRSEREVLEEQESNLTRPKLKRARDAASASTTIEPNSKHQSQEQDVMRPNEPKDNTQVHPAHKAAQDPKEQPKSDQATKPDNIPTNLVAAQSAENTSLTKVVASDVAHAPSAADSQSRVDERHVQISDSIAIPISSSSIYKLGKDTYVAKLFGDVLVPSPLELEWRQTVRERLICDLRPILQSLPSSMSRLKSTVEPELCMVGIAKSNSQFVQMHPTVWIRCGGKRCRKAVQTAIHDLTYIKEFSKGRLRIELRAPRPAGQRQPIGRNPVVLDGRSVHRRAENDRGLSVGAIAGIVVGAVFIVALMLLALWFFLRLRGRKRAAQKFAARPTPQELSAMPVPQPPVGPKYSYSPGYEHNSTYPYKPSSDVEPYNPPTQSFPDSQEIYAPKMHYPLPQHQIPSPSPIYDSPPIQPYDPAPVNASKSRLREISPPTLRSSSSSHKAWLYPAPIGPSLDIAAEPHSSQAELHNSAPHSQDMLRSPLEDSPSTPSQEAPDRTSAKSATFTLSVCFPKSEHGKVSACGLHLQYTNGTVRRTCLVGGIITVNGRVYGLTTAHSLFDVLDVEIASSNSSASSSADVVPDSSESFSEVGEWNMNMISHTSMPALDDKSEYWTSVALGPHSYGGLTKSVQSMKWPESSNGTDFALIDMEEYRSQLGNYYTCRTSSGTSNVDIRSFSQDFSEGSIEIVSSSTEPQVGYLVERPSMYMDRSSIFYTRKIQLESPLQRGISGAWVVRKSQLIGMIVAVYDAEPYAHMLPMIDVIAGIRTSMGNEIGEVNVDLPVS